MIQSPKRCDIQYVTITKVLRHPICYNHQSAATSNMLQSPKCCDIQYVTITKVLRHPICYNHQSAATSNISVVRTPDEFGRRAIFSYAIPPSNTARLLRSCDVCFCTQSAFWFCTCLHIFFVCFGVFVLVFVCSLDPQPVCEAGAEVRRRHRRVRRRRRMAVGNAQARNPIPYMPTIRPWRQVWMHARACARMHSPM